MGLVITLSGTFGSRRSELAEKLEARLGFPRVKFSDFIKARIADDGENGADRVLQQQYGQRFVQDDLDWFVEGVLNMAPGWTTAGNLIVDGLRHVEVLLTLRQKVQEAHSQLFYIHVQADPLRRETAALDRGINEQDMYRYDRALSEAQMNRILPAYADLQVDGALGLGLNMRDIEKRLREMGIPAAA